MPECKVRNCQSNSKILKQLEHINGKSTIRFHIFPKDQYYKKLWSEACGIEYNPTVKYRYVCSNHFKPSDYKPASDYVRGCEGYTPKLLLVDKAVPTENLNLERPKKVFRKSKNKDLNLKNSRSVLKKNQSKVVILQENTTDNTEIKSKINSVQKENGTDTLIIETADNFHSYAKCTKCQYALDNSYKMLRKFKESEAEVKRLRRENRKLQKSTRTSYIRKVEEAFKAVFTPQRIDKILHPSETKVIWITEDIHIMSTLALRSISPRIYHHLKRYDYPLPSVSTLRDWSLKMNLHDEILENDTSSSNEENEEVK